MVLQVACVTPRLNVSWRPSFLGRDRELARLGRCRTGAHDCTPPNRSIGATLIRLLPWNFSMRRMLGSEGRLRSRWARRGHYRTLRRSAPKRIHEVGMVHDRPSIRHTGRQHSLCRRQGWVARQGLSASKPRILTRSGRTSEGQEATTVRIAPVPACRTDGDRRAAEGRDAAPLGGVLPSLTVNAPGVRPRSASRGAGAVVVGMVRAVPVAFQQADASGG